MIGLQQNVFRPNALKWDAREQDLRAETAERQYVEAREDVALATVNAFFDVYAARVALENATTNAAVNDTLYTLNKGRFEVGKIGENDLLQSELALLRMRTSLDAARLDFDRALANLRLQLNVAPVCVTFETVRPVGADGGVVSGQGRVVAEIVVREERLPEASTASTASVTVEPHESAATTAFVDAVVVASTVPM